MRSNRLSLLYNNNIFHTTYMYIYIPIFFLLECIDSFFLSMFEMWLIDGQDFGCNLYILIERTNKNVFKNSLFLNNKNSFKNMKCNIILNLWKENGYHCNRKKYLNLGAVFPLNSDENFSKLTARLN